MYIKSNAAYSTILVTTLWPFVDCTHHGTPPDRHCGPFPVVHIKAYALTLSI